MKKGQIVSSAIALYVLLMGVTWTIGTRQAKEKTEAMLDYAVNDMCVSMDGVIDTLLDHLALIAVRHFKKPGVYSMEEVSAVAKAFDIDEINVVDRTGRIIATNDPDCLGVDMKVKDETRPFVELTNGVIRVFSQPFRRHAYADSRRKYLGVPFPGGNGYVQVGLDESRMNKMISAQLSFLFDAELEETMCYLCADKETGKLISKSLKEDMPQTLAEIGFDMSGFPEGAGSLLGDGGAETAKTFVQLINGRRVFCRSFIFGGHRFIMIEPEGEFYGLRNMIAAVMAVLLALVLGGFAFFLVRISGDAERIKAFYRAEEAARAKDMDIAKTIQTSALPVPLEANPYFKLSASMTPARDIGGDFYDFFLLDQMHLAFMVADVSGKGVNAALYMMTAETLLKDAILATRDPAAAFSRVNAELCKSNTANMFLTAWGGVLNLETGLVTFANAGHNPPVKVESQGDGSRKTGFVAEKSGPVLALVDGVDYKARALSLKPGDTIFLYTDGVTEALDLKGGLFGEERLMDAINAVTEPNPKSICNVVRMAVAAFSEGVPQADDMTVLAVEYVARPRRFVSTFPPTQDGIAAASAFLDDCIEDFSGGGREASDARSEVKKDLSARLDPIAPTLHIVLDEVCSNIVKHSTASGFEIDVELLEETCGVKLTFIDDGVPYDPLMHKDPDTSLPAEERPIGGLGIMMVRKMSDSMSYERNHDHNYLTVLVGSKTHCGSTQSA